MLPTIVNGGITELAQDIEMVFAIMSLEQRNHHEVRIVKHVLQHEANSNGAAGHSAMCGVIKGYGEGPGLRHYVGKNLQRSCTRNASVTGSDDTAAATISRPVRFSMCAIRKWRCHCGCRATGNELDEESKPFCRFQLTA